MSVFDDATHLWNMDEEGTVTRADGIGSWDLANSGTITDATGKNGNAVKSSGANSDIIKTGLTYPTEFTIAGWFKASASDDCYGFRVIDDTAQHQIWFESEDTFDRVRCAATDNYFGGAVNELITSITVTDWFFLAMRTDGEYVRFRVNDTDATDMQLTSWTPGFTKLEVAKAQTGDDQYVDELVMWDRELTAAELDTLYNSGTGLFHTVPTPVTSFFGFH